MKERCFQFCMKDCGAIAERFQEGRFSELEEVLVSYHRHQQRL